MFSKKKKELKMSPIEYIELNVPPVEESFNNNAQSIMDNMTSSNFSSPSLNEDVSQLSIVSSTTNDDWSDNYDNKYSKNNNKKSLNKNDDNNPQLSKKDKNASSFENAKRKLR